MDCSFLVCSCGCGEEFQRRKSDVRPGGLNYISVQHAGAHRTRTYLEDMCGSFLAIVTEYLDGFASQHYKNLGTIRISVCPFILFLNDRSITDLQHVTPKTITEFISWSEEVDYKKRGAQHFSAFRLLQVGQSPRLPQIQLPGRHEVSWREAPTLPSETLYRGGSGPHLEVSGRTRKQSNPCCIGDRGASRSPLGRNLSLTGAGRRS